MNVKRSEHKNKAQLTLANTGDCYVGAKCETTCGLKI